MRFWCVDDKVPPATTTLLRVACEERRIDYELVDAARFDFAAGMRAQPGDLLYRPAVSTVAATVEQYLHAPGVATFHTAPDGVFFPPSNPILIHQRAGLPTPRSVPCISADRGMLRFFVDQLGGLPLVVKVHGWSRGVGVMRADTLAGLFSLVDFLLARGDLPMLCAYVPDAVHWRVIVVGDQALACYRNPVDHDDFRTYAADAIDDYTAKVPDALAELAVDAVAGLSVELGGVDILEHPSGRLYLLEANFPCYFPQAQLVAGIDIAGAMVDHLVVKAGRIDDPA